MLQIPGFDLNRKEKNRKNDMSIQLRLLLVKRDSLTLLKRMTNKVRRMILCTTAQDYVKEQERLRSGECYQCGKCCKLLFRCPFLGGSEDNPRCTIYNDRPKPCMAFPIDERDLADVNFQCGYFFQEKSKPQLIMPSFS
jgi:hypothetical protein